MVESPKPPEGQSAQGGIVFRALADDTRRELLVLLRERPRPVQELAGFFPGMSRPAVSKHLRILKQAGLVMETRQGRNRVYQCRLARLGSVASWLDWLGVAASTPPGQVHPSSAGTSDQARAVAKRDRTLARRTPKTPGSTAQTSGVGDLGSLPGDDWRSW